MLSHEYVGNGAVCEECWLPLAAHTAANTAPQLVSFAELESQEAALDLPDDQIKQPEQIVRTSNDGICTGHTCPTCQKDFEHAERCQLPINIRCTKCMGDVTVTINREDNPKFIETRPLTGAEEVAIEQQVEEAIMQTIYSMDGKLRENWSQLIEDKIVLTRKLMYRYKIELTTSCRVRGKTQLEVTTNMTEEEREAFLAAARRRKKVKIPSEKKAPQSKPKTLLDAMIRNFLGAGFSRERAEAKARKMMEDE